MQRQSWIAAAPAFAFTAVLDVATPALATYVGVSITAGQPGFYGRIDIGNVPQPPVVVYQQPVVVVQTPVAVHQRPIYLHVPPGHEKHWDKHCAQYNACGQPVYFVREDWYQQQYVPAYEKSKGHGEGNGKGHGKGKGNKHGD